MAEQDLNFLEEISEELSLVEEETNLFAKIIAGIYCNEEGPEWEDALKRLGQQIKVRRAVLEYFKRNPIPKEDINFH